MSRIEETLRDTFRERVAAPYAAEDIAERAIDGARRVRRSRMAFASLAAALSVALVGVGVATLAGPDPGQVEPGPSGGGTIGTEPPPTTPGPAAGPPVDLVIGDRLLVAGSGAEIPLAEILASCDSCWVSGAWHVPDGYLVSVYRSAGAGGTDISTLWHVPGSGAPSVVVVGDGLLLVSPGTGELPGIRVAWLADGLLWFGRYTDRSVTGMVSTPAPEVEVDDQFGARPLYPRAVVGDAVVLAGTLTGGGLDFWDAWFPGRGDFVPEPAPMVLMYARTPDSERIIGSYFLEPDTGSKETCLAEFAPDGFDRVRSICPNLIPLNGAIRPSPDGRWWMAIGAVGVTLYEAEPVWSGEGLARRWTTFAGAATGAWLDSTSFLVMTRSAVTIIYTDGRPDEPVPVSLPPADATQLGVVVEDLR